MNELIRDYLWLLDHEWQGLLATFNGQFTEVSEALLVYAYAVSVLWTLTSLVYVARMVRKGRASEAALPPFTVLVPFYGEPDRALRTARSLDGIRPAPSAVILVDDGSAISIGEDEPLPAGVSVLRLPLRQGKAGALKTAMSSVTTPVVVCLDADTEICSKDWRSMLAEFDAPEVGAVTGKIWPVANGSLVGRFQELDYLAVISLIKAAETIWGGLMTVSGAIVAYRVAALQAVGGFNSDKATEDIDASWRLQLSGWRLAYHSRWAAEVEMAPTVQALWRQRRRWSSGLGQALRDYGATALTRGARHLPIVIVTLANILWVLTMLAITVVTLYAAATRTLTHNDVVAHINLLAMVVTGLILFSLQFLAALLIDGRSWRTHLHLVPLLPLYPVYFWFILLSSFLVGFPTGVSRRKLGVWQPTARAPTVNTDARPT